MSMHRLGFAVRVARSDAELNAACTARAAAYGHHLPALREALAAPDALDRHADTAVIVAVDPATEAVIGTARIATNATRPLQIEASVALPPELAGERLAEVTRLAVAPGQSDPAVKRALFKAIYLHCRAAGVAALVIGARCEALIRQYRRLGFGDLGGAERWVPLAHAGGLPHRVLAFDVDGAERRWREARHPLLGFMVHTWHPDIALLQPMAQPLPAEAHTREGAAVAGAHARADDAALAA